MTATPPRQPLMSARRHPIGSGPFRPGLDAWLQATHPVVPASRTGGTGRRAALATALALAGLLGAPLATAANLAGGEAPAQAHAAAPTGTAALEVITRAGDTLERLARRHHPGTVLTPAALAQAWWRVNAAVFPAGPPRRLPAGLRLRVPTELELVRLYFPAALAQAAAAGETTGAAGGGADAPPTAATGTTRPRWVRFP